MIDVNNFLVDIFIHIVNQFYKVTQSVPFVLGVTHFDRTENNISENKKDGKIRF